MLDNCFQVRIYRSTGSYLMNKITSCLYWEKGSVCIKENDPRDGLKGWKDKRKKTPDWLYPN